MIHEVCAFGQNCLPKVSNGFKTNVLAVLTNCSLPLIQKGVCLTSELSGSQKAELKAYLSLTVNRLHLAEVKTLLNFPKNDHFPSKIVLYECLEGFTSNKLMPKGYVFFLIAPSFCFSFT